MNPPPLPHNVLIPPGKSIFVFVGGKSAYVDSKIFMLHFHNESIVGFGYFVCHLKI